MATLRQHPHTDIWQVRFYWDGLQRERSCRTKKRSKALRTLVTVEETIEQLQAGRIVLPEHVNPVTWITSGGKVTKKPQEKLQEKTRISKFGDVCDNYLAEQEAEDAKALTTIASERTHIRHLTRLIKRTRPMSEIELDVLKRYRDRRKKEKYRGKPVTEAIRRELATFRLVWIWAQDAGIVSTACPLLRPNGRWRLQLPKPTEKIKFQTWDQITRRVSRGGLTENQIKEQWDSLYLDWDQVQSLLDHVKKNADYGFIYPMFAFTGYTGARRSEVLRSRIDDVDFDIDQVMIRERKRRKDRCASTRFVPLHPKLKAILAEWFQAGIHPGGQNTIAAPAQMPRRTPTNGPSRLTWSQGTHHFKRTLNESKWQVVHGFHVLRHSFGSNLIRTGKVTSDTVGEWMGHTSDEMRELYQHLFPQDGVGQISVLE